MSDKPLGYRWVVSHTGAAAYIMAKWPGKIGTASGTVSGKDVGFWCRMQRLPQLRDCREAFPMPTADRRFEKNLIDKWAESYLILRDGEKGPEPYTREETNEERTPREEQILVDTERKRWKFEQEKKAKDKNYILVSEHEAAMREFGAIAWQDYWSLAEMEWPAWLAQQISAGVTGDALLDAAQKFGRQKADLEQKKFEQMAKDCTQQQDTEGMMMKEAI